MIIIGYDPLSAEVVIDFGDGRPPLSIHAEEVEARLYGNPGLLSCLPGLDVVDVEMIIDADDPGHLVVEQVGDRSWRVQLRYDHPEGPRP